MVQISELDEYLLSCSSLADTESTGKPNLPQAKPTVLGVLANSESKHLSYPKQGMSIVIHIIVTM